MINSTPLSSQLSSQPATPEVRTVNPAKKSDEPVAVEHTPFLTWKRDHRSRPLPDYRVKVLDEPVADPLQVKPELPIVLESPPLPEMAGIPDALKAPFTKNLISLVEQLKQEQYEKGIEQCKKLRKFAECKQHLDTPEIMQFLDSLYVLFSLSLGKKEVIDQLHTADPDTFIRWHLDIAASAAPGSDNKAKAAINSDTAAKAKADTDPAPLKPPKELELYCLRRAADAGSQTARQHLVLQLLFGQEDQKPDVYLPEEALRYIKAMATEQGEPPQPLVMGHHGAVIRKLVKLATNPTTEDREALTKELAEDSDPNIQALAVALYLKPLFGATDIDRALAEANTLNSAPDSHPHLRYWQALAQLKKGEPALVEQAEASLEKLVRQNYPAAIRVATEHYMRVGNIFKVDTFVVGTKDNGVPVEYCPDLAHTLATACEYLETEVKTVPLGWSTPGEKKEMRQNYKNIAISHCCPEARLASLASLTMDIPKKNRPKPSRDEPVEKTCLPEHARDLLHQCRFSEDPETLVFIYLDQLQQTGKSDEKLLDLAMAMDPVRTCCRMLALKVYSEKWSYQALTTKLYSLINDVADLPEDWQQKPSQKALYYGLTGPHHTLTPDCEKYFRLASQLAYGYQSLTPDETGIYDDLKERYAKFLMHQGKPEAAKRMFSSYEKTNKSLARGYDASTKVPEDYSVFQKDLPACYWDLTTFETKSDSTPVASFKYQKLLDLQQTIASHPDPALHQAWSETCRYFLDSSGKHLTNEQIMDLSQRMIRCQQQVDSLTASMLNQSRQMIEARAEQLALTQGSSEPLERIRNQWGQVTFPGVPRKNLAAADSGQSSQRRLPERRPNSQVMEHHLEAPLRAAETAEERLELLQQLLAKGTFNTPVITTLALEAIETLPPERHEEALECLSQLAKRLTDDVLRLANRFRQSLCEHIQALHVILYDPPERRHCEALALRLEDMKICAGAVNLRQLSEVLHPAALYRERGLHNQVIAASEPFAEQLDRMLSSIDEPKAFVDYARYLAGKTLSHEETRALQELPEKVREQQKPLAKLLSDYVLGKRCKGHILRTAANTKIFLDFRVDPLSIGLEAGIISAREVRQNARWFDSNSVYSNVLYALSANTIEELKDYHGKLETSTRMNSKDCKKMCRDKYFVALGFKSLKMGDFKLAYNCFKNGQCDYGMAMLAWKHSKGSLTDKTGRQIAKQLDRAAGNANTEAQCRLIDWMLGNEQVVQPLLKKRACRFLFSPVVVPSVEREFYQGVVEYLGMADDFVHNANQTAGLTKIRAALDSESPIPALRLVQLTANGKLSQEKIGRDSLLLFAQKLNRYKGNLPQELKLAEPTKTWEQLADRLEAHSGTTTEADSADLLAAAQTLRRAVEPAKAIVPMRAKVKKTAASRKKASEALQKQQLKQQREKEQLEKEQLEKEQRAEKEQTLLKDLTSQLQDVMAEPQAVLSILNELKEVQGARFPEVADHLLPRLASYLPVSADNNDLTVAFFRNIQAKEGIDEVINELLDSFKFRFEIRESSLAASAPQSITEEKETLLRLLPDNLKVTEANREAMGIFTGAFAPDFPEKLQRILKLPHNAAFLQRTLLEHSELTPDSHPALYRSYNFNRAGVDEQARLTQSKTNDELLETLFCDLSSFTASDIERYLLKHPHLPAEAKIKHFQRLELPVRQKLLATVDTKVISEGTCQIAANPRRKLKQGQLRTKAQQIIDGKESPTITDILSVYMGLKGYLDVPLAQRLHPDMERLAGQHLQTPPEQWDGSMDRLCAMAIKHILSDGQAESPFKVTN